MADHLSLPHKILCAGASACFADLITFPLDTAKVRLQIQGELRVVIPAAESNVILRPTAAAAAVQYRGLVGTLATIAKVEGVKSLFNGLSAGLQRQLCFSSIRIGFYDHVKQHYQKFLFGDSNVTVNYSTRTLAGLTTGGMAVMIAQPTDVVKVRFQAQMTGRVEKRYTSTIEAYRTIAKSEGAAGLWKGTLPNASRNAIVNVAEIVCYDIVKDQIIARDLMKDSTPCHFVSAVIAGLCATVVASPVDVIKTRYMNSAPGTYKNSIHCAVKTFKKEGSKAFFKGLMNQVKPSGALYGQRLVNRSPLIRALRIIPTEVKEKVTVGCPMSVHPFFLPLGELEHRHVDIFRKGESDDGQLYRALKNP